MVKDPWFGKRRGGYGWMPLRPMGWLVAVAFTLALIVCASVLNGAAKVVGIAGVMLAFGATCWITGGPPGSVS